MLLRAVRSLPVHLERDEDLTLGHGQGERLIRRSGTGRSRRSASVALINAEAGAADTQRLAALVLSVLPPLALHHQELCKIQSDPPRLPEAWRSLLFDGVV